MNEDYRLRRLDEFNWVVDRRVRFKKENSKSRPWRIIGYFPSLDQAAQRLFDRVLLSGKSEPSIESLIREVKDARAHISALVLRQPSASRAKANPEKVGGPRRSQMSHLPQGATGKA